MENTHYRYGATEKEIGLIKSMNIAEHSKQIALRFLAGEKAPSLAAEFGLSSSYVNAMANAKLKRARDILDAKRISDNGGIDVDIRTASVLRSIGVSNKSELINFLSQPEAIVTLLRTPNCGRSTARKIYKAAFGCERNIKMTPDDALKLIHK